jgi:acyl-CoA synthetase (AMP-forming)/AMP-acid ligase II
MQEMQEMQEGGMSVERPAIGFDVLLKELAERHGDKAALVFRDDTCGFRGLRERALRVEAALGREGLAAGARIATLDKNHIAHFELLFGAAGRGVVLVPISFRLVAAEVEHILREAEPALLFVGPEHAALATELARTLPHPPKIIHLEGSGPGSYAEFVGTHSTANFTPERRADPDDAVLQLYTSGTTGLPKGALLSHRNLHGLMDRASQHVGVWRDDDVFLLMMPLFHIGGTASGLIGLYNGATTVILREAEPGAVLAAIEQHGATKMFVVPALLLFLLSHPRIAQARLGSLRLILYGASPISEALLRRAMERFPCEFGQVYGLTETCGTISYLSGEDHKSGGPELLRSAGRPLPGIEMRVVDPEGRPLPPGAIGEVVCRADQVMLGYYKQPAATAAVIRDGWFHSGDAGYFDEAGYLYIHDRVKDMIISGGENIYPAEVESALAHHPAVADAAVIGVPDPTWGEAVHAFVVLRPPSSAGAETEAAIIEHVRSRISRFKVPRAISFVASLPRNAAGKLLKRELREPFWKGQSRQVS